MVKEIKIFGAALDALSSIERVNLKQAYLHYVRNGTLIEEGFEDPYDLVKALTKQEFLNRHIKWLGKISIPSWLTPKPQENDSSKLSVVNLDKFLDGDGCWDYAVMVADYIGRKICPGMPVMIGVDHSLTGGSMRDSPADKTTVHDSQVRAFLNQASSGISRRILKDRKFLLIGTSYLLIGFSVLIPLTFISTYAVQELMFRYDVATRVLMTIAAGSVVGKLVLGHLSDSLGRIRTIIICQILIAMGNLGIVYFPELLSLNLWMLIFGFGHGAIWPLYALCAPDYFSKSEAGFIVGFWTLFLGIGFMLSPIIAGWIADVTGTFVWSFVLAAVTAMMSTFLLLFGANKNY